ncbi:hypothetical protein SAMN04488581_2665 [Mycolicibacterium neoaurum]|nr:hypothetical protein SAMN04488581_2665 [Mycolicibacterium neoaurum]
MSAEGVVSGVGLNLPNPPEGCRWKTAVETTVKVTLIGPDTKTIEHGSVAVDLYGWSAVGERAQRMVARYGAGEAL